jgi:hypothetical protein
MKTGLVDFDRDVDSSLLPARLAGCLRGVDADEVEITDNRVTFEGGIFRFVTNWNVLVPFGFGDLTVCPETRQVRYRLSYRQLVIFSATMIGVMEAFVLAFAGPQRLTIVIALSVMWFFALFTNLALGIPRFEDLIRRAVASAPRIGRIVQ